jgi:hypothetical protein
MGARGQSGFGLWISQLPAFHPLRDPAKAENNLMTSTLLPLKSILQSAYNAKRGCFIVMLFRPGPFAMKYVLRLVGALAIVTLFFFGTLFVLDHTDSQPEPSGIANARTIAAALEKYRADKGAYPVLPVLDSPVTELFSSLVNGRYLSNIPTASAGGEQIRYVSVDGRAFGLRVVLSNGPCIIEVGISKSGWWGNPPPCLR